LRTFYSSGTEHHDAVAFTFVPDMGTPPAAADRARLDDDVVRSDLRAPEPVSWGT
jgi:hypothetical protein